MAQDQEFGVSVVEGRVSAQDWLRAAKVSRKELEQQGMSARDDLARAFAEERLRSRGADFGGKVQSILAGMSDEYRLIEVVAEPRKARWLVKIQTARGIASVAVPEDLADDVVDSGALQDLDELKRHLEAWLMRTDLIAAGTRNDASQ
jgi:hypothetical protein